MQHESLISRLYYNQSVRRWVFQAIIFVVLLVCIHWVVFNTLTNLKQANIASGFDFLDARAGIEISWTLLPWSQDDTYGYALLNGLINTLFISILCIVAATLIGVLVGIGRLSRNFVIRSLSTLYVEIFRNIPLLLVILFGYFGVLQVLPDVRSSIALPHNIFINQRGFYFPAPQWPETVGWAIIISLMTIAAAIILAIYARQLQARTGKQLPVLMINLCLLVGGNIVGFVLFALPQSYDIPQRNVFNIAGGVTILPEFLALFFALSLYAAAFIAENVRSGLQGVDQGVQEAALSLGLKPSKVLRLITLPLSLRLIIPPLSSQYMNIIKNSSLAVAIGYPEISAIGKTIMDQRGQPVEIMLIWMAVYLGLSLLVSVLMNWFNARMRLVEN